MVNKNILIVLLCTFSFLQAAENRKFNSIKAARALEEFVNMFVITREDEQALQHEQSVIFDINSQKNRRNQNTCHQKYGRVNTQAQKKYNSGKHRNNSGR